MAGRTIISTIIMYVSYFLLLYAIVAFVQDKKWMGSAAKEVLEVIPDRKERFRGAHGIGWCIVAVAILLFIVAAGLGAWDGVKHDFGFWRFFARFITMMYLLEIYDIVFFDWILLCHSDFFPRYYHEVKGIVGPRLFGYNMKSHIIHFLIYIPVCLAAAGMCLLL